MTSKSSLDLGEKWKSFSHDNEARESCFFEALQQIDRLSQENEISHDFEVLREEKKNLIEKCSNLQKRVKELEEKSQNLDEKEQNLQSNDSKELLEAQQVIQQQTEDLKSIQTTIAKLNEEKQNLLSDNSKAKEEFGEKLKKAQVSLEKYEIKFSLLNGSNILSEKLTFTLLSRLES